MHRLTKTAAVAASTLAVLGLSLGLGLWLLAARTEAEIAAHHAAVARAGRAAPSAAFTVAQGAHAGQPAGPAAAWAGLPAPVQRYFAFVFRAAPPRLAHVEMQMQGQFRRPRTLAFTPTSATQTVATGTPALMFAATTQVLPGVWARAYDAYVDGRMEMKAKLMSAVALVDERSSPELDRISLRRWLLESPLYPMALLPGGPVQWQAIDAQHARAVVAYRGITASLVATFDAQGRLLSFDAEADGDLDTPYHGSGEHAARSDYQSVDGVMVPMGFQIARAAGGKRYPFWQGRITALRFVAPPDAVAALR